MTDTKSKDTKSKNGEHKVAKTVLIGTAVVAGGAAAMALKDKKNRTKVKKAIKTLGRKGKALKTKAEEWAEDHPNQTKVMRKIVERAPGGKMVTQAIAGR